MHSSCYFIKVVHYLPLFNYGFYVLNFRIIVKCPSVAVSITYSMIECTIIHFMILFSFKKKHDDLEIEKRRTTASTMSIHARRSLEFQSQTMQPSLTILVYLLKDPDTQTNQYKHHLSNLSIFFSKYLIEFIDVMLILTPHSMHFFYLVHNLF